MRKHMKIVLFMTFCTKLWLVKNLYVASHIYFYHCFARMKFDIENQIEYWLCIGL